MSRDTPTTPDDAESSETAEQSETSETVEQSEPSETVDSLGEFGLIARVTAGRTYPESVLLGPGDDAAVVTAADGRVVITTDMLVEGRHFRRDWSGPRDIGRKAVAQNGADIAAMGARCTAFVVSLSCPADLTVAEAEDLNAGLWDEASRAGGAVVGGDVTAGDHLVVSVTAVGDLAGASPIRRDGARPGDVLAVSGPTGASAAGYALFVAEVEDHPDLLAAHRVPQPDYDAGPAAARAGATAMCDVSDGLLADAAHLAVASGVVLAVESARLPVPPALREAATQLGADVLDWVLGGGEDHVLLATFPADTALPPGWTVVGGVGDRGEGGAGIVTVDGTEWTGVRGWTSF